VLGRQPAQKLLGVADELRDGALDTHEVLQLEWRGDEGREPAAPSLILPAKGAMRLEQLGGRRPSDLLLEPALGQGEHAREADEERASAGHGPAL
jgi:hypothetical protein